MRPDLSSPVHLGDLLFGEHLIVWAFRTFARGRDCLIVRREFDDGCGERTGEAYAAMRVFVQQILQAPRAIVLAPPGALSLARDEQMVLRLFGAVQAGDGVRVAHNFHALTGAPSNPGVERAVALVAEALRARGHRLRAFEDLVPVNPDVSRLTA